MFPEVRSGERRRYRDFFHRQKTPSGDVVHCAITEEEVMIEMREIETREIEMRELTDTEVESVCGGISDLGKYITKAVDDVISSAIGG